MTIINHDPYTEQTLYYYPIRLRVSGSGSEIIQLQL